MMGFTFCECRKPDRKDCRMTFDPKFYLSLILRRLPIIIAIVFTASMAGILYAVSMPPVYRAEARLLIESPQIPDNLAASTVVSTADEILLAIRQRIMTRDNLLAIATSNNLLDGCRRRPEQTAQIGTGWRSAADQSGQHRGGHRVLCRFEPERRPASPTRSPTGPSRSIELRKASGNTLEFRDGVRRLTASWRQNAEI
jgi:hypothetical protein